MTSNQFQDHIMRRKKHNKKETTNFMNLIKYLITQRQLNEAVFSTQFLSSDDESTLAETSCFIVRYCGFVLVIVCIFVGNRTVPCMCIVCVCTRVYMCMFDSLTSYVYIFPLEN